MRPASRRCSVAAATRSCRSGCSGWRGRGAARKARSPRGWAKNSSRPASRSAPASRPTAAARGSARAAAAKRARCPRRLRGRHERLDRPRAGRAMKMTARQFIDHEFQAHASGRTRRREGVRRHGGEPLFRPEHRNRQPRAADDRAGRAARQGAGLADVHQPARMEGGAGPRSRPCPPRTAATAARGQLPSSRPATCCRGFTDTPPLLDRLAQEPIGRDVCRRSAGRFLQVACGRRLPHAPGPELGSGQSFAGCESAVRRARGGRTAAWRSSTFS